MRRLVASITLVLLGLTVSASADVLGATARQNGWFGLSELRADAHKLPATETDQNGIPVERISNAKCVNGMAAGTFRCSGVDLLSFVPLAEMDGAAPSTVDVLGGGASDLWGWTDPNNGDEYVIMGKTNGVAFFNITDPRNPIYLGQLENKSPGQLIWHDIKVHENHAFIVSESVAHGMDVFDLTRLRGVTEPQVWTTDAFYPTAFSAHNIAINEETGFAYIVGGNTGLVAPDQCLSGLHIVNIQEPQNPTFAGCHAFGEGPGTAAGAVGAPAGVSYVHDTQCVVYDGTDTPYRGRELCFNSSETHMSVVDVTDKLAPKQIAKVDYPEVGYAHQGWLTEDHRYFLMGDELDEYDKDDARTRTLVFDVTDLDNIPAPREHVHGTTSIDHNMYVKDDLVYQSNYTTGLRVLDVDRLTQGHPLPEVAFFDTYPKDDSADFFGTWSNYPYFPSGTIAVSGIDEGLFLLKVRPEVLARQ